MIRKTIVFATIAALVALGATLVPVNNALADNEGRKPIFPLAKEAGLTTLVAAVKAAGLQGTLSRPGPYTVFAPTNEAFAALGEETLAAVLADRALLTDILLYHVAAGELVATDVLSRSSITMANGETVNVNAGDVEVGGAGIVATDIMAGNGVVHVIDAVLLPPSVTAALTANVEGKQPLLNTAPSAPNTESRSWGELKSQYR
jgi:uncharacterized surface protein with fasciclin (FAS1) repeats